MGCSKCAGHEVQRGDLGWRWIIYRGDDSNVIAAGEWVEEQEEAQADLDDLLTAAHAVAIKRGLFDEQGQYIGPTAVSGNAS